MRRLIPAGPVARRNHTGQRYGRWTITAVLGYSPPKSGKYRAVLLVLRARCDCGRSARVYLPNLVSGASTQCRKCGNVAAHKTYRANNEAAYAAAGTPIIARDKNGKPWFACGCGQRKRVGTAGCRRCAKVARFGRPWKYPESIQTVGDRFGVTRERVRQVVVAHGWQGMLNYFADRSARLAVSA